jgi:hypothetical protein
MDLEIRLQPALYWIRCPEPLRLALLAPPRGGERLDNEVRGWRSHAVSTVISLVEPEEEALLGLAEEQAFCEKHGIEFVGFSMPLRGAPDSYAEMLAHARLIVDRSREGCAVALHAGSDFGRAALTAACALVSIGVDSQVALDLIAATRGQAAPESDTQGDFITDFEDRYRAGRPPEACDYDDEPARAWG